MGHLPSSKDVSVNGKARGNVVAACNIFKLDNFKSFFFGWSIFTTWLLGIQYEIDSAKPIPRFSQHKIDELGFLMNLAL